MADAVIERRKAELARTWPEHVRQIEATAKAATDDEQNRKLRTQALALIDQQARYDAFHSGEITAWQSATWDAKVATVGVVLVAMYLAYALVFEVRREATLSEIFRGDRYVTSGALCVMILLCVLIAFLVPRPGVLNERERVLVQSAYRNKLL